MQGRILTLIHPPFSREPFLHMRSTPRILASENKPPLGGRHRTLKILKKIMGKRIQKLFGIFIFYFSSLFCLEFGVKKLWICYWEEKLSFKLRTISSAELFLLHTVIILLSIFWQIIQFARFFPKLISYSGNRSYFAGPQLEDKYVPTFFYFQRKSLRIFGIFTFLRKLE